MVSFFGFGKKKCPVCSMELKPEMQTYEWEGKKFCSQECKRNYRVGKKSGGSCH